MSMHAQRKGRISSKKIRRLVVVSLIVAVFALGATAAVSLRANQENNRQTKTPTPQPSSAQSRDVRADQRFHTGGSIPLNPQSGQVRPLSQEEAQRLAASIKQLVNQSTDGLKSVEHADGSVSMDLQGRFENLVMAKRTEDGELVQSCVDNPEAAAVFFGLDPALVGVTKNTTPPKIHSAPQQKGVER